MHIDKLFKMKIGRGVGNGVVICDRIIQCKTLVKYIKTLKKRWVCIEPTGNGVTIKHGLFDRTDLRATGQAFFKGDLATEDNLNVMRKVYKHLYED